MSNTAKKIIQRMESPNTNRECITKSTKVFYVDEETFVKDNDGDKCDRQTHKQEANVIIGGKNRDDFTQMIMVPSESVYSKTSMKYALPDSSHVETQTTITPKPEVMKKPNVRRKPNLAPKPIVRPITAKPKPAQTRMWATLNQEKPPLIYQLVVNDSDDDIIDDKMLLDNMSMDMDIDINIVVDKPGINTKDKNQQPSDAEIVHVVDTSKLIRNFENHFRNINVHVTNKLNQPKCRPKSMDLVILKERGPWSKPIQISSPSPRPLSQEIIRCTKPKDLVRSRLALKHLNLCY